ncbi:hypothetical protein POTOM_021312 [Populus tomentosa]|uniref:Protein kinase domain-containing protein n=1 Tax=Populus tomentosa TaxID=118781 RepID=A0A8X7ZRP1_POPTO|nr:hypothetical protein POTOM_021312 [Populus tomentosa]
MNQLLLSLLFLFYLSPNLHAQQNYSGNAVMDCDNSDATGPSPAFLYTCNGKNRSCQAFLIYKSQPPYNTISSFSNLLSADPLELARINNFSSSAVFPTDKEVIVPILCSCSGKYYQANTSYTIPSNYDTYFTIANYTYGGLATCSSLIHEINYSEFGLDIGKKLQVPLRCACPASNQTKNGTKYLLSYLVSWGDEVRNVSRRFNACTNSVTYANGFTEDNPTVFPFTTFLIQLSNEPSSSQTIIHYPLPPNSSPTNPLHRIERPTRKDGKEKKILSMSEEFRHHVAEIDQGLKIYKFEELRVATKDFSTENRKDCLEVQSWNFRIQITLDVANGLHYLHNFTDPICVHKRICSSNVQLNRHLRAKIANFSCALSAKQEEYMNSSMRLALGEKGCLAPEYIEYGLVAPEIDVYAFGVVLLELITGKEAVFIQDAEEMKLSEAIISIMEEDDGEAELGGLIDPCLMEKYCSMKLVLRLVKLSQDCLEQEPESRPGMGEIVSLLKIQVDVQKSEPYLWRGVNF